MLLDGPCYTHAFSAQTVHTIHPEELTHMFPVSSLKHQLTAYPVTHARGFS